ncbi:MAG: hypothetical protein MJ250_05510 [Alphaproteobacteria bacterium]|nr:hypothetical protein [Alphaproteobacteria bacterium]
MVNYTTEDEDLEKQFSSSKMNDEIQIIETTNLDIYLEKFKKLGYVLLGTAEFEKTQWYTRYYAKDVAQEKGANIVLIQSRKNIEQSPCVKNILSYAYDFRGNILVVNTPYETTCNSLLTKALFFRKINKGDTL